MRGNISKLLETRKANDTKIQLKICFGREQNSGMVKIHWMILIRKNKMKLAISSRDSKSVMIRIRVRFND